MNPVEALENASALDAPAGAIASVLDVVTAGPVKPLLRGDWLGHALHPLLTDVPIGTWTSALLLDVLGGDEDAADLLLGIGLVSAPAAALTGWSDWHDEEKRSSAIRRAGIAHGVCNATAIGLQAASLVARRSGARGRGLALSAVAMGLVGAGGWLGGHLSYARGSRVEPPATPSPSAGLDL